MRIIAIWFSLFLAVLIPEEIGVDRNREPEELFIVYDVGPYGFSALDEKTHRIAIALNELFGERQSVNVGQKLLCWSDRGKGGLSWYCTTIKK